MRKAIAEIRDGTFAKRWAKEQETGTLIYQRLLNEVMASPLAKAEAELYAKLGYRSPAFPKMKAENL
jgi:ketol-acid reductoisomerase